MTLKSNVTTNYVTATVASTSIANIDTFAKATFRTAKYIVQATQGSNYQINEIIVTHDGTTAEGGPITKLLGTAITIGDATSGNFNNLDEYENTYTVTAVSPADFVDYANQDYRIQRNSALYKSNNGMNFGAIQNEDFEFVSVS